MAPELALKEPYNQKVDVYSWSLILWEMLSLESPYQTIPHEQFLTIVCKREERPELDNGWPKSVRDLICRSWANLIPTRPTMQEVYALIECAQVEVTKNQCIEDAETRKPAPLNGLGCSPPIASKKREPLAGSIRTAASTPKESIAGDCGTITQHARGDHADKNDRVEDRYKNVAQRSPSPTILFGGRPAVVSRSNASAMEVSAQPYHSKEVVSEKPPKQEERTEEKLTESGKREQTEPRRKEALFDDDSAIVTFFSLEELKSGIEGIPPNAREQYLRPDEFEKVFGMTRENFNNMRLWRKQELKKKIGLF